MKYNLNTALADLEADKRVDNTAKALYVMLAKENSPCRDAYEMKNGEGGAYWLKLSEIAEVMGISDFEVANDLESLMNANFICYQQIGIYFAIEILDDLGRILQGAGIMSRWANVPKWRQRDDIELWRDGATGRDELIVRKRGK